MHLYITVLHYLSIFLQTSTQKSKEGNRQMTFIRKFLNMLKIDNSKSFSEISLSNIQSELEKVKELAAIANKTTDIDEFCDIVSQIEKILTKLSKYEHMIDFTYPPSQKLKDIQNDRDRHITLLRERLSIKEKNTDQANNTTDKPCLKENISLNSFINHEVSTQIQNKVAKPKRTHVPVSLRNIKAFWKAYPQTYNGPTNPDASTSTYLLYAKTLLLWAYGKCCPVPDGYCWYFTSECHLSNPRKLHIELINDGYLGLPSAKEVLSKYKMPELKIIANSVGCRKGGKKSEIIERIISSMHDEELINLIEKSECYSLTEKGMLFLSNNYDLVELHRHQTYNISLSVFFANRIIGNKKRSFWDNAFSIISQRILYKSLNRCYYQLAQDYHSLYDIALYEGRYKDALEARLTVLYLNTCLIHEAPLYINSLCFGDYWDVIDESVIVFTEYTAPDFVKLQKIYSPIYVDNIYKDYALPPSFLSVDEFKQSLSEMLCETIFDFNKYNIIIRERLKLLLKCNTRN